MKPLLVVVVVVEEALHFPPSVRFVGGCMSSLRSSESHRHSCPVGVVARGGLAFALLSGYTVAMLAKACLWRLLSATTYFWAARSTKKVCPSSFWRTRAFELGSFRPCCGNAGSLPAPAGLCLLSKEISVSRGSGRGLGPCRVAFIVFACCGACC